jgi:hypothetical protein
MTEQPNNPYGAPGPDQPHRSPQGWGAAPQQGWAPPAPNGWGQPFPDPSAAAPGFGAPPPPGFGQGYVPPPKPGVVPLRPLGIGDLLDGSFQAIRRNAAATLGLAVLIQLACGVAIALMSAPLYSVVLSPEVLAGADPDAADLAGSLLLFSGGILLAGILSAAFLVFVQGMTTIPVLRAVLNRKTTFGQALSLAKPALGRLVALGLLWSAAGLIGTALLVGIVVLAVAVGDAAVGVPLVIVVVLGLLATAIWVSVKLSMTAHALVVEDLGAFASMSRSWRLTRSSWWRCLGILLLTGVIVAVVTSLITTPLSFATGLTGGMVSPEDPGALQSYVGNLTAVMTIVSAVAAGLGFAYQCGVSSLLYTDLRIRREGFDLTLLREFESGADSGIPGRTAAGPEAGPL